jgi:Zn-dependent peptidase ImmA (M78 family)
MNVDGTTDRLRQICRLYLEPLEGSFFVEFGILPLQSAEKFACFGNSFASAYLLPEKLLMRISEPNQWDEVKLRDWCHRLFVNAETLSIALHSAGLITNDQQQRLKKVRLPATNKLDPELPDDLSPLSRERKLSLLRSGLSSRYVSLCFEAYHRGIVTAARLAEMLLVDERELTEISELFGVRLNDVY